MPKAFNKIPRGLARAKAGASRKILPEPASEGAFNHALGVARNAEAVR
jgi:hypothetical protein